MQMNLSKQWRILFLLIATFIVIVSMLFTNHIANSLAREERNKVEIWAEATRQFIMADENTNIDFFSDIIEQNTTIPVYMTDAEGNLLFSRNVHEPKRNVAAFYSGKIKSLQASEQPIEVRISPDVVQYIYYEDSTLLKQLYYFPYIQFAVICLFVLIVIYMLSIAQHNEQNMVWAGLSKETAHQLGTPISSLNACSELLKINHPDDELVYEMDKDIQRLQAIAERFSKIGSDPVLTSENLMQVLAGSVDYMRSRTSEQVQYEIKWNDRPLPAGAELPQTMVMMNRTLMEWVVENLCKNAVDAMENKGTITLSVHEEGDKLVLDISDTGKGIERKHLRDVFKPGYTTKKRGWGLGLSLAKRIIEQYHKGKIFVWKSVLGEGTTFRIVLHI